MRSPLSLPAFLVRLFVLVGSFTFITVMYQSQASSYMNCSSFGEMDPNQQLPYITPEQLAQIFQAACADFSNVGSANGYVHWWEGLLVQDFFGDDGNENGAIFYDVNILQGAGEAYVLWGPILQEYWGSSFWGPPISDRTEAWPSDYNDGTTGHLVRFNELDAYYNDRKQETYVLRGVTRDRFNQIEGTAGLLGFPESEGLIAADSGYSGISGWYQNFEGGIMHTAEIDGVWQAWEIHGAIQATYNSLPGTGSGSALGFPESAEIETPPSAANPAKKGVYQRFEGGRIYYDALGAGGTTFVLYNNVIQHFSPFYNPSNVDNPQLGFPIGKMTGPDDCLAFFELGYINCNAGIQTYGGNMPHPPLPGNLHVPYEQDTTVYWTGGPHAYGRFPSVRDYSSSSGTGSGIDFANGNFEVTAITSGTVVDVRNSNCANDGNLGCRVAIRSDYGGTIFIYGHLQLGSIKVKRFNVQTGQTEEFPIERGMYIAQDEAIGTADSTGTDVVHLHLEMIDGTGRSCPTGWLCYPPGNNQKFGIPVSWHNTKLENYGLFAAQDANNASQWMNYEGTAVRYDDNLNTKTIATYYFDEGINQTVYALAIVHNLFQCPNDWCWNNSLDPDRTIFSAISNQGCIGGCRQLEPDGEVNALLSEHELIIPSYDPNNLTLTSPGYGYPPDSPRLYLPIILGDGSADPVPNPTATPTLSFSPTSTPAATATPTPTPTSIPNPPPETELLGPFTNNGGFESSNMEGWNTADGTIDVTGDDVHSGVYSVHGSSGGDESEGEPPVRFYRQISLEAYQVWIQAGLGVAYYEGWLHNGNSEYYRFFVRFYDANGNQLTDYDTGWIHDAGGGYHQYSQQLNIPVNAHYVHIEAQMKRNAGDYTDVDIDDLTFKIWFSAADGPIVAIGGPVAGIHLSLNGLHRLVRGSTRTAAKYPLLHGPKRAILG